MKWGEDAAHIHAPSLDSEEEEEEDDAVLLPVLSPDIFSQRARSPRTSHFVSLLSRVCDFNVYLCTFASKWTRVLRAVLLFLLFTVDEPQAQQCMLLPRLINGGREQENIYIGRRKGGMHSQDISTPTRKTQSEGGCTFHSEWRPASATPLTGNEISFQIW